MPRVAEHTIGEEAQSVIQAALRASAMPKPRVLWWDEGGHLEDTLRRACDDLNVAFRKANGHPLDLRREALAGEDTPERAVWYVDEAKADRDWFRDIREAAADPSPEITENVFGLAARLYGARLWQLVTYDPERAEDVDAERRSELATLLLDELSGTPLPSFQDLQSKLITRGDSRAEEVLLREGWQHLERDETTVERVRDLLSEAGVPDLAADDGPEGLTDKTRRWAIGGWLLQSGLSGEARGTGGTLSAISDPGYAHRRLKGALSDVADAESLAEVYLHHSFFPEALRRQAEQSEVGLWQMASCPVEGALDARLWEAWLSSFDDGEDPQACEEKARRRADVLQEWYGADLAHTKAWRQAERLAALAQRYAHWEGREADAPVHQLYGSRERGTWRIDAAVRAIITSGTPESGLPKGHPALERLGTLRDRFVRERYVQYLRQMGEVMEESLASGQLFEQEDLRSSYEFWEENEGALGTGSEAALFYLDALRLDLARELAARLEEEGFEVKASLWLSTLPSETEFGMSALLPGRPRLFEVSMDEGKLRARRGQTKLPALGQRKKILEEEGWATTDPYHEKGWEQPRVAYFDTELDDIGENELDEIERHLTNRVNQLAELITSRLERGGWSKAYVVTDHGFVLLPEGVAQEPISAPVEDKGVKRRRAAGAQPVNEAAPGVLLDADRIPALSYLRDPVRVLVDPQHRYSKRGISDARYFHGGALAQECLLCFLEIERT